MSNYEYFSKYNSEIERTDYQNSELEKKKEFQHHMVNLLLSINHRINSKILLWERNHLEIGKKEKKQLIN